VGVQKHICVPICQALVSCCWTQHCMVHMLVLLWSTLGYRCWSHLDCNVITACGSDSRNVFATFRHCRSVNSNMITDEPLHLDWWNFARTCTLTTCRSLLNIKVKGQGHMGFFVCFFPAWYCLNRLACIHEMSLCHSLDGATLLLPAVATNATRGQYLALSKAWRSRCRLLFSWIQVTM